jgi:hypothetical protein
MMGVFVFASFVVSTRGHGDGDIAIEAVTTFSLSSLSSSSATIGGKPNTSMSTTTKKENNREEKPVVVVDLCHYNNNGELTDGIWVNVEIGTPTQSVAELVNYLVV